MSRLRVHAFAISLDGYGAGPGQDHTIRWAEAETLHQWLYPTRTTQSLIAL